MVAATNAGVLLLPSGVDAWLAAQSPADQRLLAHVARACGLQRPGCGSDEDLFADDVESARDAFELAARGLEGEGYSVEILHRNRDDQGAFDAVVADLNGDEVEIVLPERAVAGLAGRSAVVAAAHEIRGRVVACREGYPYRRDAAPLEKVLTELADEYGMTDDEDWQERFGACDLGDVRAEVDQFDNLLAVMSYDGEETIMVTPILDAHGAVRDHGAVMVHGPYLRDGETMLSRMVSLAELRTEGLSGRAKVEGMVRSARRLADELDPASRGLG